MATHNEAADKVGSSRPATGIHAVAAMVIAAKGSSRAELDLAAEILRRNPDREEPREIESVVGSFNRQTDAVIESCNFSAGASTRAERRIRLARDLDAAGVLLVDRNYLAGLIADRMTLELERAACNTAAGEDLGAELLDGETVDVSVIYHEGGLAGVADFIGGPIGGSMADAGGEFIGDYSDPNVND